MAIKDSVLNTQDNTRVFGMLAAKAGVGKTTQATTFPKDQTRIISAEEGLLSLAGSGFKVTSVDTFEDILTVLKTKKEKYIIIDSLTEIYEKISEGARDKFTPSQNFQKFSEINYQMFHVIKTAKFMRDRNIFFICHTKEDKNGLVLEENLCFDGKLPEQVKKEFDLIVHMQMDKEGNRRFATSPKVSKIAKARVSPWLNVTINDYEEANLFALVNKLTGVK